MARTVGSLLGVSKQTEMLVMTVLTLWVNIFDMALFELGANLEQVWNVPIEITKFTPEVQNMMKILLAGIVFVRTFSLHLYIAFLIAMFWPATFGNPTLIVTVIKNLGAVAIGTGLYICLVIGPVRPASLHFIASLILELYPSLCMWIVGIRLLYITFLIAMFWPATFGTRPTLMLPWLTVSAIKNIGAGLVTFGTGLYTCLVYGPMRPACLRFVGSQILDLSPSLYMWIVGISLYRDLRKPLPVDKEALKLTEEEELNMALRRRKVKSMVDEEILRKQFEYRRKFIGLSAVEVKEIFSPASIEETYSFRKISRSLDSLLDAMTAEAEIMDSEDFEPLEDGLNIQEKTAKLLGITMSEISRIKQNQQTSQDLPMYPVRAQKKQIDISNAILKHESPLKLLTETSLYTPSTKPVRPTKSELKCPKDFLNLKSPFDFMQTVSEIEIRLANYTQEQTSDNCTTETIFKTGETNTNDKKIKDMNTDDKVSSKKEIDNNKSESIESSFISGNSNEIVNSKSISEESSIKSINSNEIVESKSISKESSIKSVKSNERQKSSEVLIKQTDLDDVSHSQLETELQVVSNKVSNEIGCQVSTLSKRILNAPAREISEKLSNLHAPKRSKSRTIPIRPPSSSSQNRISTRPPSASSLKRSSNQTLSSKSRSFLNKSSSSTGENSYLSMHLHKLELEKSIDKIGVDKFGVVSRPPSTDKDRDFLFGSFGSQDMLENIPRKKFENITFKF